MKFQKSYNEPRKRKNYLTKEGRNMQRGRKDKEGGVEWYGRLAKDQTTVDLITRSFFNDPITSSSVVYLAGTEYKSSSSVSSLLDQFA